MKVFFDIITNHTADVITYEQTDGGPYAYISKDDVPYKTAAGDPFDDRDFAGTGDFPALDPATSFPYTPVNPAGSEDPGNVNHKVPEWLNDVTLYHNRGDTTYIGENSLYGDFVGLDDLFTEDQRVVDGMKEIYKQWITDFRIDGFRIDTMKHVNDEFWQDFAPDVLAHAKAEGKSEFLMFGEVFDTTKTFTSHFTTHDKVQAVIDFPFQAAAQRFAAASGPTSALRDFFVGDDWYTDADSNVYQLPTFLGNHDMGRIGRFVRQANAGASDDEVFDRDRLAHELMYFSRGNPVIYYGDEQGFVGDGGDQDARQDMFPSDVDSYNDDDLIATDATTAESNFDTTHPLYEAIGSLASLTKQHPALRNGPQQSRYSTEGAGIYAFSRLDRAGGREYVVALNNSEQEQTAFIPTSAGRRAAFSRVYGEGEATAKTDAGRRLGVTVPPLSTVVYRSDGAIPLSAAAPDIAVEPLPDGGEGRDRAEVRAFVDGSSFYDVTFQAKVGGGEWTTIGTDDNEPYRVFHEVAGLAPGTTVQYRATVLDNAGHTRTSDPEQMQVAEPAVALTAPTQDGRVSGLARLTAEVTPDDNDNSVRFERSVDGGAWETVGTDASQPAYTVSDDVSAVAPGAPVEYRAVLTYAPGKTVTSAVRAVTAVATVTTATIHYDRSDNDYVPWGLHLFGAALAPGEGTPNWTGAAPFEGTDAYGALHEIGIADDEQQVGFIVHGRPPDGNPDTKDPNNSPDRFFTPIYHPEIWLKEGDATIYFSAAAALVAAAAAVVAVGDGGEQRTPRQQRGVGGDEQHLPAGVGEVELAHSAEVAKRVAPDRGQHQRAQHGGHDHRRRRDAAAADQGEPHRRALAPRPDEAEGEQREGLGDEAEREDVDGLPARDVDGGAGGLDGAHGEAEHERQPPQRGGQGDEWDEVRGAVRPLGMARPSRSVAAYVLMHRILRRAGRDFVRPRSRRGCDLSRG